MRVVMPSSPLCITLFFTGQRVTSSAIKSTQVNTPFNPIKTMSTNTTPALLEDSANATLLKVANAALNPQDPFWDGVKGGCSPQRQQALKDCYNTFPAELFDLATQRNSQGLFSKYITITDSLVSPDVRKLDLQIQNPKLHDDGSVSFMLHMYGLMLPGADNRLHLIKIGGERRPDVVYLKGLTPVLSEVYITKAHVESGAVSQRDYDALVKYVETWNEEEAKFRKENPKSSATNWMYVKKANPDDKKPILSVIPANNNFELNVRLVISMYNTNESMFRPAINYEVINIRNFTLLGSGASGYRPVMVDNGADNPPVAGVALPPQEAPSNTLPQIPAFTIPGSSPTETPLPTGAATPQTGFTTDQMAAFLADPAAFFAAHQTTGK